MKKNIVDLFNQITQSGNPDLYGDIIQKHYEKFKFFYKCIKNIECISIDNIRCEANENELLIFVNDIDESVCNDINEAFYKGPFSHNMNLVYRDSCMILLLKNDEENYYEDRFT
ncbi:MAG: hypothetical protein PHF63_00640 [Herbinix sp.]|nr:hypothetical protein [Herbinix sp.]